MGDCAVHVGYKRVRRWFFRVPWHSFGLLYLPTIFIRRSWVSFYEIEKRGWRQRGTEWVFSLVHC